MAHTIEELERLLVGRKVLWDYDGVFWAIIGKGERVITVARVSVDKKGVLMYGEAATGSDMAVVSWNDIDRFLAGERITYDNDMGLGHATLLPAEEEPAKPDAAPTEAIAVREPGDGGEAVNEYFRREGAKGRTEEDITKDFLEGPEILIEQPTAERLADLDAGVQQLQAATEFFAKEPERTYTTAEVVSVLGALRSAMATTREQSEPAKPKLPGKWEERWWQVYLRFYVKGFPNAAEMADKAVDIARKHLEGE